MEQAPDDLHRLLQETLTELGWDADAAAVAKRIRRLDIGLPAEDEFSVVCAWLGKLNLLHKLDQHQVPANSKQTYQVPDLLARFETQKNDRPLLIEVKKRNVNTLSFKPDYLERLLNYSKLMGMPLLVAWKFHSLWVLFDAEHLEKAVKNFNISFSRAMKENLLGILAGDVAYKIGAGAGFHLRFKKEKLIAVEETEAEKTEEWEARIDHVEFTDRNGCVTTNLSSEIQSLLNTWDLEEVEEHHDDHVWLRYVATEKGMQFGHTVLVRLLDLSRPADQARSWRREMRKDKLNTIADLRAALNCALKAKIVQYVLLPRPQTEPDYLQGQNSCTTR